jgi:hypothetical protein
LGGVTIRLGLGVCPSAGIAAAATAADGTFAFQGLPPATYCLSIDSTDSAHASGLLPGVWSYPASSGSSVAAHSIAVVEGEQKADVNFGWDYQFLPEPPPATPAPTPTVGCVDRAAFVGDVTIPDKTFVAPGASFVKTWRLTNSGSCAWNTNYALVFVGGHQMQGPAAIPLPTSVAPGGTVDLSVALTAPAGNGAYRGEWKLRSAGGVVFGIGDLAEQPFWVHIVVGPTPTPPFTATPKPTNTPVITNWRGEYFNTRTLTGNPLAVRDDASLDFNWGSGAPVAGLPADNFAVRWKRTLNFNMGTYRFRALADDGVRVWMDEQLVIDDWKDGGAGEVAVDVALTQGAHAVRVEYYESAGLAAFKLWWEPVGSPAYPDWKAEYWTNRAFSGSPVLVRNDRFVDFDWGQGAPAAGLPADDFAVRWSRWVTFEGGLYRFSARADDGLRVYVDGKPIMDEWHDSDGAKTYAVDVSLTGPHALLVEYYDRGWRAMVKVGWERLAATPTPTATRTATPTATATATSTPTQTPTATATQPALSASISGMVWRDVCALTGQLWNGPRDDADGCVVGNDDVYQADGVLAAGEQGIASVVVALGEGPCGTMSTDPRIVEARTDANGRYSFAGLHAGTYCLVVNPEHTENKVILFPGLWTNLDLADPSAEAALTVHLTAGEARQDVNLGWDYLFSP